MENEINVNEEAIKEMVSKVKPLDVPPPIIFISDIAKRVALAEKKEISFACKNAFAKDQSVDFYKGMQASMRVISDLINRHNITNIEDISNFIMDSSLIICSIANEKQKEAENGNV